MKATQIRELSADDITARVAELERERFNLRFRAGTQPLEDPLRLRAIRRELARLKTVLREKSLAPTGGT
ncbi:MAG: 50S ribosomal protein L29 [Gemmatimonadota bacterium]|nr:50S ribosomal protein L29 [Gemmatimonadota bacterium]